MYQKSRCFLHCHTLLPLPERGYLLHRREPRRADFLAFHRTRDCALNLHHSKMKEK
jgi:hypothetical protein